MTKVNPTPNEGKFSAVKFDGTNDQEIMDTIQFPGPLSFTDQYDQLWIFDSMDKKFIDTIQSNTWIVLGPYYGNEPLGWAGNYEKMTEQQYQDKFGTLAT
jgi:hypothetical protein